MALRRAYADEYAIRVNRAAVLLRDVSSADAVRALQAAEFGLQTVLLCSRLAGLTGSDGE
jgi:hypothetical protein